jgi:cytochrome c553
VALPVVAHDRLPCAALVDALTVDTTELDDARWFTAREMMPPLAGDPQAPSSRRRVSRLQERCSSIGSRLMNAESPVKERRKFLRLASAPPIGDPWTTVSTPSPAGCCLRYRGARSLDRRGETFHSERPEEMGYPIEGVVQEGEGEGRSRKADRFLLASADAAAGEQVFKKCTACHNADKGGANALGPNLWGVLGEEVGKWRPRIRLLARAFRRRRDVELGQSQRLADQPRRSLRRARR